MAEEARVIKMRAGGRRYRHGDESHSMATASQTLD